MWNLVSHIKTGSRVVGLRQLDAEDGVLVIAEWINNKMMSVKTCTPRQYY